MKVKITRRGFRKAPANIEGQASARLAALIDATGATRALATLRPATYCGEDSPGAQGAYMLEVHLDQGIADDGSGIRHDLSVIYPPAPVPVGDGYAADVARAKADGYEWC